MISVDCLSEADTLASVVLVLLRRLLLLRVCFGRSDRLAVFVRVTNRLMAAGGWPGERESDLHCQVSIESAGPEWGAVGARLAPAVRWTK